MELTPEQVVIVGLVASGLAALFRLAVSKWGGQAISKAWMTVIVAGLSMGLTVAFNVPELPAYTSPLEYIGEWATLVSAYVGAATVIYNIVLSKVLDAIPAAKKLLM